MEKFPCVGRKRNRLRLLNCILSKGLRTGGTAGLAAGRQYFT
jgi:hypothetical protein